MKTRNDGRRPDELRPLSFEIDFQVAPTASVLAIAGKTKVICSVNILDEVPSWMRREEKPGGWLTAEYRMLPGATPGRARREADRHPGGRSSEIQRLIGRSLRAAVDLDKLPGKTIQIDCDVLDADGGTRCASICGAAVAVELGLRRLFDAGEISDWPMKRQVAAVSVGMVAGEPMLDLCYVEDKAAEVDMNVVMTARGEFIEIQGTAEEAPFSEEEMNAMLALARGGLKEIFSIQKKTIMA